MPKCSKMVLLKSGKYYRILEFPADRASVGNFSMAGNFKFDVRICVRFS